jgi:hypothetical protein
MIVLFQLLGPSRAIGQQDEDGAIRSFPQLLSKQRFTISAPSQTEEIPYVNLKRREIQPFAIRNDICSSAVALASIISLHPKARIAAGRRHRP